MHLKGLWYPFGLSGHGMPHPLPLFTRTQLLTGLGCVGICSPCHPLPGYSVAELGCVGPAVRLWPSQLIQLQLPQQCDEGMMDNCPPSAASVPRTLEDYGEKHPDRQSQDRERRPTWTMTLPFERQHKNRFPEKSGCSVPMQDPNAHVANCTQG